MRFTSLATQTLIATFTVASASNPLLQPVHQYPIHALNSHSPKPTPAMSPHIPPNTQDESTSVTLSDVLPRSRSINIFAGFTRDFAPISERFSDSALNTTILAPLNSAIMALPRKPWEDSEDYERLGTWAYEGGDGEQRAKDNLRRFVERHVVAVSPMDKGVKFKTLGADAEMENEGREIWWEEKDGKKVIQPGNVEVLNVESTVHNGEVWILKGVLNYARN